MEELLKPVPSVSGLEINHDGTIVYHRGEYKKICYSSSSNRRKQYKYVTIDNKKYSVAKLVFETYIGKYPVHRRMRFIDGNHLNTDYRNLAPRKVYFNDLTPMKKVNGFDDLYINCNGTIISQHGYELSIHITSGTKGKKYYAVTVHTNKGAKEMFVHHLVAIAWLNWDGKKSVSYKNGSSNYYKNLRLDKKKKGYSTDSRSIPKKDRELVIRRLLNGDTLRSISKDYNCSDMAVVRFKKRYLSPRLINSINKNKNINTKPTSKRIVNKVIAELKQNIKQIDIAKKYKLSPTVVCRINRQYIKQL